MVNRINSLTHLRTYLRIYSLIHFLAYSLAHSLIYSLTHSLNHLVTYLHINLMIINPCKLFANKNRRAKQNAHNK